MSEAVGKGFPRWDIEPALVQQELLPIPEFETQQQYEHWCAMANYMYAGKGYRTQVPADHYTISKVAEDGEIISGAYSLKELSDSEDSPEPHTLVGILGHFELRPDIRCGQTDRPLHKILFARLASVEDLDEGVNLSTVPNQHVLVPLGRVSELLLENF